MEFFFNNEETHNFFRLYGEAFVHINLAEEALSSLIIAEGELYKAKEPAIEFITNTTFGKKIEILKKFGFRDKDLLKKLTHLNKKRIVLAHNISLVDEGDLTPGIFKGRDLNMEDTFKSSDLSSITEEAKEIIRLISSKEEMSNLG